MEFEDILLQVGGFGKYQKNLIIYVLVPITCVFPFYLYGLLFMLSVPEHWCDVDVMASSNLSLNKQRSLISPPSDPSCSMYSRTFLAEIPNFTATNTANAVPCPSGWRYDKENYESTAATKWNMVCESDHLPALLLSLPNIGSLIFTPVYGVLSDKFGRKTVFLLLAVVVTASELASALVSDVLSFAVLRTIHGTVLPTIVTLPFILSLEMVAPQFRARVNFIFNVCWTIGFCLLSLAAYLSRTWVNLSFICTGGGILVLCCARFLPESPCWLISQGRHEDALSILVEVGKKNQKLNREQLQQQLQTLGNSIQNKKKEEQKISKLIFFKYPRLRKDFLILSFSCLAVQAGYYGLTYNMVNLDGNEFLNFFLLSVVELPGNVLFWHLMDSIGRRATTSSGFLFTGLTLLMPVLGFQYSDILSTLVGKTMLTGVYMTIDQQCSEIFPTVARSFGTGTAKTVATGMTLFIPYISHLKEYGKEIPFVFISVLCLVAVVVSSFLPETLNENLPQTLSDAENFGKEQKYFSLNGQKKQKNLTESKKMEAP